MILRLNCQFGYKVQSRWRPIWVGLLRSQNEYHIVVMDYRPDYQKKCHNFWVFFCSYKYVFRYFARYHFVTLVVLLYLTFQILHFEVYDILKCKNFLIGFLNFNFFTFYSKVVEIDIFFFPKLFLTSSTEFEIYKSLAKIFKF